MQTNSGMVTLFTDPNDVHASDEASFAVSDSQKVPTKGVLPYQQIKEMIGSQQITSDLAILPDQVQPSSLDLRLGQYAYQVTASFLPGANNEVMQKAKAMDAWRIDLEGGGLLQKNRVYVVPLMESVRLPQTIAGIANPKSSTGRLDVLTRLITDGGTAFDQIDSGYRGSLFVEVAPQTFDVVVRPGTRLNQVRFHRGQPALASGELSRLYDDGQLVRHESSTYKKIRDNLVPVTVDLKRNGPDSIIGYKAKSHAKRIDMDSVAAYDPHEFWDRIWHHRDGHLILDPGAFYILATCEDVGVPPHLAAEMVPYNTKSGEYRVHYAGFFDPGFGWNQRAFGSKAVLEVRSHEIPFLLEHGQTVGWLKYEQMLQRPDRIYGMPSMKSNYQNQGLALAKQFRRFEN